VTTTGALLAPPEALVLTVDELRVLHRVAGAWLPAFAAVDDPVDARVDAAALRGLAARGLVELPPLRAGRAPLVRAAVLTGLRDPRTAAEVVVESRGTACRFAVAENAGGDRVLLSARPGGLLDVSTVDSTVAAEVARRCEVAELAEPTDQTQWTVPAVAHVEADERAVAGDPDAADTLIAAGVAPDTAGAWIRAVATRRRSVAVGAASRGAGTAAGGGELRWLVGGDRSAWRVEREGDRSVVTRVGPAALCTAIAALCAPPDPRGAP